ncbi:MAG: hypothetical protein LBC74_06940 [Planctomycetaceae bacterium]|jgi:hypothetical protein|nr:hypothetical protein [Planctomycetaceae bacterium]
MKRIFILFLSMFFCANLSVIFAQQKIGQLHQDKDQPQNKIQFTTLGELF